MAEQRDRWTLEWYVTANGEHPLHTFLESLTGRNKEEAIALIELLEKWGNRLRPPRSRALGDGLFELRGHQVRIFYVFRPGRRVALLDGMIKKQDRIPQGALGMMREYQRHIREMDTKGGRTP